MPEIKAQVDRFRQVFSMDIRVPFELKPGLVFLSPTAASPPAFRTTGRDLSTQQSSRFSCEDYTSTPSTSARALGANTEFPILLIQRQPQARTLLQHPQEQSCESIPTCIFE